jgi:hypothetical protein
MWWFAMAQDCSSDPVPKLKMPEGGLNAAQTGSFRVVSATAHTVEAACCRPEGLP